jgi:hypothetical protein
MVGFDERIEPATGKTFDFARKKVPVVPKSPTLKDWLKILPSSPLKTNLERRVPTKRKKKDTGLPNVKSGGISPTTGETRTPGGKVKRHDD